ncbi:MAG: hypothetical protein GF350_16335 [Chitinivibrionales bacterium]|nr:hypothetical protein [Chitinivibrionales bacterium]
MQQAGAIQGRTKLLSAPCFSACAIILKEEVIVKIALTVSEANLDSRIEAGFGRCPYFIIVDPDTMKFEALENPNSALGGGGGILSAQLLLLKEIGFVFIGNCGPNAFYVFSGKHTQCRKSFRHGNINIITRTTR